GKRDGQTPSPTKTGGDEAWLQLNELRPVRFHLPFAPRKRPVFALRASTDSADVARRSFGEGGGPSHREAGSFRSSGPAIGRIERRSVVVRAAGRNCYITRASRTCDLPAGQG